MGTSVTWRAEVRRGGQWYLVDAEFDVWRNHQLFYALSGVRADRAGEPRPAPRFVARFEVPADASEALRELAALEDAPPHDYRTLAELQAHAWPADGSNFQDVLGEMAKLGAPDDVRAIWWFW